MRSEILPRVLPLEGCSNLRDLGGYRAADGRTLRFGQVFRSASLVALTGADLKLLATAGLRSVVDFRGEQEAARAPSRLPPGARIHPLPIEPRVGASLRDLLARKEATSQDVRDLLRIAYRAYATEHLPRYRALFDLLLDAAARPLLFHCSAGKDRTGFGAVLLLTALGIPREVAVGDYLATNCIWKREHALPEAVLAEVKEILLSAHRDLIEMALDLALVEQGGEDGLMQALGLTPPRRRSLRDALLE